MQASQKKTNQQSYPDIEPMNQNNDQPSKLSWGRTNSYLIRHMVFSIGGDLVRDSIAVKRHQDHGNSYKHFNGVTSSSEVQLVTIMGVAWWHTGRHRAEVGVLHLDPQAVDETLCHTEYSLSKGDLRARPTVTHFLLKAMPPNSPLHTGHFLSSYCRRKFIPGTADVANYP